MCSQLLCPSLMHNLDWLDALMLCIDGVRLLAAACIGMHLLLAFWFMAFIELYCMHFAKHYLMLAPTIVSPALQGELQCTLSAGFVEC